MAGFEGGDKDIFARKFLTKYPTCCKVLNDDFFGSNSVIDLIVRPRISWISVHYEMRVLNDGEKYYEAFIAMDSCCKVLDRFGIAHANSSSFSGGNTLR